MQASAISGTVSCNFQEHSMSDMAPGPGGKISVYSSPMMHERRRRILDAARRMISERGLKTFSMRELGHSADVALRTLYNAFGSRDHLLAVAVKEYYEEFVRKTRYRYPADTVQGTMERLALVHGRNIRIRNYTRTIMSIYFSTNIDRELWTTIHRISADNYWLLLSSLRDKHQLHESIDLKTATDALTHLEYAMINEWCQERISDAHFVRRLMEAVLTQLSGLTRSRAHTQINDMLNVLRTKAPEGRGVDVLRALFGAP
jgi:TetR/AcrR family transcriptional regulator, cholesterol catabolism regulator